MRGVTCPSASPTDRRTPRCRGDSFVTAACGTEQMADASAGPPLLPDVTLLVLPVSTVGVDRFRRRPSGVRRTDDGRCHSLIRRSDLPAREKPGRPRGYLHDRRGACSA